MSGKLAGKVAIVTGASKGIGTGIAKQLAADGAAVVINYASSKSGADAVVQSIQSAGGKAIAIQASLAIESDVIRLFAETIKAFGRLDILVNNAGVYNFGPLEQFTVEDFRRQFDLNVMGTFLASREAAKCFGDKGGNIINISSVIARQKPAGCSVYGATKAAVNHLTAILAQELGKRNIRVNAIAPGIVETEGTVSSGIAHGDMRKVFESQTPLGRIGQPDDIGVIASYLASDEARWVTGEVIYASGGQ